MFSLFSHSVLESNSCDSNWGGTHFFGAFLRGCTFLYKIGEFMNQDASKKITDVSGVDLSPGEPDTCLGNGDQEFECFCDECDYILLCFPEFDPNK